MNKDLYNYSIRLLSQRDYSRYKMRKKLKTREATNEEIEEVIEKLEEQKYLQEEEYTRQRVQYWLRKGYSPTIIIQKAKQEQLQINEDQISIIAEKIDVDPLQKLEEMFERRFSHLYDEEMDFEAKSKINRRAMGYFMRRGFNYEQIKPFLR